MPRRGESGSTLLQPSFSLNRHFLLNTLKHFIIYNFLNFLFFSFLLLFSSFTILVLRLHMGKINKLEEQKHEIGQTLAEGSKFGDNNQAREGNTTAALLERKE